MMISHGQTMAATTATSSTLSTQHQRSPVTSQRLMKTQVVIPSHQCHYCFYQYSTLHPCLFCPNCLEKCHDVIDRSNNGIIRRNIHKVIQEEKVGALKKSGLERRVSKLLGGSMKSSQEEQRWAILEQKTLQLEKRATRCGFCLPTEKRTKLVRYCGHCQKHMCRECDEKHTKHTLTKHHATVDLLAANHSALL